MFYFEVFEALNREKIKYMIVGRLAVNLHGVPRLTYGLNAVQKKLGYIPRLPVNPDNLALVFYIILSYRTKSWI